MGGGVHTANSWAGQRRPRPTYMYMYIISLSSQPSCVIVSRFRAALDQDTVVTLALREFIIFYG